MKASIVLILCVTLFHGAISDDTPSPCAFFECTNETTALIGTIPVKCGADKICNDKCMPNSDPAKKPQICVDKIEYCTEKYDCATGKLIIDEEEYDFECPDNTVCVDDPCNPCQEKTCDKTTYKCLDKYTVSFGGLVGKCTGGFICNAQYKVPCDYCIDPKATARASNYWMHQPKFE